MKKEREKTSLERWYETWEKHPNKPTVEESQAMFQEVREQFRKMYAAEEQE